MIFHQRFIPGLAIYSYLIADDKTRAAAVVDHQATDPGAEGIAHVEGAYVEGRDQIRRVLAEGDHVDL